MAFLESQLYGDPPFCADAGLPGISSRSLTWLDLPQAADISPGNGDTGPNFSPLAGTFVGAG